MSKFFDTNGIPTERSLKGFFDALDEARTNEEWFGEREKVRLALDVSCSKPARDVEVAAKRMIERAVRRSNHVLRNIHRSRGKRLERELTLTIQLLEDARRLLADERGTT